MWDKSCLFCGSDNQYTEAHELYFKKLMEGRANDPLPEETFEQHNYQPTGWIRAIEVAA